MEFFSILFATLFCLAFFAVWCALLVRCGTAAIDHDWSKFLWSAFALALMFSFILYARSKVL